MKKDAAGESLAKTTTFARQHYGQKLSGAGVLLFPHCVKVARQAEQIAHKLYQDVRADYFPENTKDSIAAIVQVALLHEVLNVSACSFESIAEVATVQIAAMVADISRDFRLVETKRDMEFRGRLSQSPVGAQIVVAANVLCTGQVLLQQIQKEGLPAANRAKKLLTQLDGDLLALHAANRYYMLRMYAHAARNLLVDVSHHIKDCKHKARADKLAAKSEKRLRERLADKEKQQEQELRYARKQRCDGADKG
jgi:hypothetical protein